MEYSYSKLPSNIVSLIKQGIYVYCWSRNGEYLYVGKSSRVLSRIGNHNVIGVVEELLETDTIDLYSFKNEEDAEIFEREMHELHLPKYQSVKSRIAPDSEPDEKFCLNCGGKFIQTVAWKKFCKPSCSSGFYEKQKPPRRSAYKEKYNL
jgi:hypothetical protein